MATFNIYKGADVRNGYNLSGTIEAIASLDADVVGLARGLAESPALQLRRSTQDDRWGPAPYHRPRLARRLSGRVVRTEPGNAWTVAAATTSKPRDWRSSRRIESSSPSTFGSPNIALG